MLVSNSITTLALVFMLFFSSVAHSDLDELELSELMHINVSVGSLFDESELDVANTIDVVTSDKWTKTSARTLSTAIDHLPSVFPLDNLWGIAIPIRGFSNNLSVRGTSYLVDGVSINNLSDMTASYDKAMMDLGGIQKIELLRGPGSSVHGSDAFHGVVSLQTYKQNENRIHIKQSEGSNGWSQGIIQGSNVSNKITLNASYSYTDQQSLNLPYEYTDPSTNETKRADRNQGYHTNTGIGKINLELDDNNEIEIAGYTSTWNLDEGIGGSRGLFQNGLSVAEDKDVMDSESRFSMGKILFKSIFKNKVELDINSYYWHQKTTRSLDFSRVNSSYISNRKKERTFGTDITLKQDPAHNNLNTQWLMRYQFRDAKILRDSFTTRALTSGSESQQATLAEGYNRKTDSLVIQGKTGIWRQNLYAIYAARLDKYSDVGEQTTPKAGFIFRPNDQESYKFTYGQAFRAPSPNEILGSAIVDSNPNLKPETIDTYELSYLAHFVRSRLLTTVFYSSWEEGIEIKDGKYQNNQNNKSEGLEISYSGFKEHLTYDLSGSYVESINSDLGEEYSSFPTIMINFGFGYEWPHLNLTAYWSNKVLSNMDEGPKSSTLDNPKELPTYYRSSLHFSWIPVNDLKFDLDLRNIFDRDNYLPSLWNAENGYVSEPFNVSFAVSYVF